MGIWMGWLMGLEKATPQEGVRTPTAQKAPGWGWEVRLGASGLLSP